MELTVENLNSFFPRTEFNLASDQTKEMVVDAVKNMPYKGGNTATGRALDYIRTELFTEYNGAREGKILVHKL